MLIPASRENCSWEDGWTATNGHKWHLSTEKSLAGDGQLVSNYKDIPLSSAAQIFFSKYSLLFLLALLSEVKNYISLQELMSPFQGTIWAVAKNFTPELGELLLN